MSPPSIHHNMFAEKPTEAFPAKKLEKTMEDCSRNWAWYIKNIWLQLSTKVSLCEPCCSRVSAVVGVAKKILQKSALE